MGYYQLVEGNEQVVDVTDYCLIKKETFIEDFLTGNVLIENYTESGGLFYVKYKFTDQKVCLIYKSLTNGVGTSETNKRIRISEFELDSSIRYFFISGYDAKDTRMYFVALNGTESYVRGSNSSSYWFYWEEIVKTYKNGSNLWIYETTKSGPCSIIGSRIENLLLLHHSIIAYSKYQKAQNTLVQLSDTCAPVQTIIYGAPGTGKSHTSKENTFGKKVHRTTFHPETDYNSFVGAYKPVSETKGNQEYITYRFVPQIFTNAYLEAWQCYLSEKKYDCCLLIEELNRGNCAQIFGNLFQLLDRNNDGFSEYSLIADTDLSKYLKTQLGGMFEAYYNSIRDNSDITETGEKTIPVWNSNDKDNNDVRLCLPPNLSIVCTMNTSDQSLFPMDSAFKRRWDWKYVPIDYNFEKSDFTICIDEDHKYKWLDFLKVINDIIYEKTKSDDKQMGNFFVKGNSQKEVNCEQFISKVMFYLWNEICKDNPSAKKVIFINEHVNTDGVSEDKTFTFNDLFTSKRQEILIGFMRHLKDVRNINPEESPSTSESDENNSSLI